MDAEERDRGLELPELFDARGATTNPMLGAVFDRTTTGG